MISVLVVDDNPKKIGRIRDLLATIPDVESPQFVNDLVEARRALSSKCYDLLVLDVFLPERFGDNPSDDGGIRFLEEIKSSVRLLKPYHIIGLTGYDALKDKFEEKFSNDLWILIKYEEQSNSWSDKLKSKIEYLIQSKRELGANHSSSYEYDLAIITALRQRELESVLNLPGNWESVRFANDSTEYHKGVFQQGEKRLKVVAASAPQMGMVATAILSQKLIKHFRPKYLAMTGIAAGVKGGDGNFGDILVSDLSFDSGCGKIKVVNGQTKFLPDYKSIPLNTDLKERFISLKGNRAFLDKIKNDFIGKKPNSSLELLIGPLATGAGVVEDSKLIEEIQGHSRKLIGIDMETYAVFYAACNCSKPQPLAFSVKSISDFANEEKNDDYQMYAAYTSATYLYNFILEIT